MRMFRRPEIRALLIAGTAAAIAIAALCGLLVARATTQQQFRQQTTDNCEAINDLKAAIRDTFMDARDRALSTPGIDAAQRVAINAAYAKEIARYKADDCPNP